ncbi:hypothetical protein BOX08_gp30 [Pseudoalteromonas phage BS5]|uniref:hypothetical protein n=1 Tax=Pseudoalteromonas phage BS5 TaxID=1874539 RepID=UPI00081981AC|nr:hypothetical protein BOX08_gp30 [Pseudoalteromonas phage BS5]ANY29595.1 hypothetical protein [Pseudoalteromonas phage BS5]
MKNVIVFLLAYLTLIAALIVGYILLGSGINEQAAERKNYCELVSMWEEDAELGIEPTKRDGHPNYKEIDCEL